MAAILRVKRKKDDERTDALLISCKRQKVENDETSTSPLTAIVKFAGTVEKEDVCVVKHITKTLSKDILKENFKQHIVEITKKAREKTKLESRESRYKIISNMRSLDTSLVEDLEEDVINIIDVEDTKAVPEYKDDTGYVYDLYYTETKEDLQLSNLVSVLPIEEDLVFDDCYEDNEDRCNDTDDSNSESNWRNDYPDSDHSAESVEENDIRNAMQNLNVEHDLSSDDEDFAYGLDEKDVDQHGYKYAKYKARIKKEKEEYDNSINAISDSGDNESDESNEIEYFHNGSDVEEE